MTREVVSVAQVVSRSVVNLEFLNSQICIYREQADCLFGIASKTSPDREKNRLLRSGKI